MSSTDVAGNPPKAVPSLKIRTYSSHNKTHAIQISTLKLPCTQLLQLQSTLQSRIHLEAGQAMLNNDEHGEKAVRPGDHLSWFWVDTPSTWRMLYSLCKAPDQGCDSDFSPYQSPYFIDSGMASMQTNY